MTRDEPLDPRHLPRPYSPATVFTDDRKRFFADVSILESGWVRAKRWDQSVVKLPPQQITKIEMAETESTQSGDAAVRQATHGLVDADALEQARRLAQPTETDAEAGQEAVADD